MKNEFNFASMTAETPKLAIVGAVSQEIEAFCSAMQITETQYWCGATTQIGKIKGIETIVTTCGVGKVSAAMTTQHLIDTYRPDAFIFSGLAGALNPVYEIGDILVARDCVQHDLDASEMGFPRGTVPYTDYRFFETDKILCQYALSAHVSHTIHLGRIVTGDQFVSKRELAHMQYLTHELAGDAVEMEGAAVGQVCTMNKVPFLIIRTISDRANQDAFIDFTRFLPVVASNSLEVVLHILYQVSLQSR